MLKKLLTTIIAAGALGQAVHAATPGSVSYTGSISFTPTDWSNGLSLQQFNPSLGTLDSIEISLSSGMNTIVSVTNAADASSSSGGNSKTEVQISLDTSSIGNYNLFNKNPATLPILDYTSGSLVYSNLTAGTGLTSGTLTGSSSADTGLLTDSSLLSYFTGSGDVNLGASTFTQTELSNNGGNTSSTQVTSANLSATITYDYSPVPEPSPVMLISAGLMSLVFVRRLRTAAK